ncbi:MAG: hypothetical protein H7Y27_05785 [Gemmatimonadaceae bacterium]|nr:hypothetical protein [Chitinophagaceae bacterium]
MRNGLSSVLFIVVIVLASLSAHSQDIYRAGYLVKSAGDTLRGVIDVRSLQNANENVRLKSSLEASETARIPYRECESAFITEDQSRYLFVSVTRDLTFIDPIELSIQLQDSLSTEKVPLRVLHQGKKLTLFHLYDRRDHFFVDDRLGVQELLQRYRYLTEWQKRQYVTRPSPLFQIVQVYLDQMKQFYDFDDNPRQNRILQTTLYNERSMLRLFRSID